VIGIIGAFIGGWLLLRLGIHLGGGLLAAVLLLSILGVQQLAWRGIEPALVAHRARPG
jgi:uncharacterized membrane protein YeaQ/YmgE (transglycosylase-associated protein family)